MNEIGLQKTETHPIDNGDMHKSEVFLGYHTLNKNGVTKKILLVSVRGTGNNQDEWSSNMNIGGNAESDWTDSESPKGFDIIANRIMRVIQEYSETNDLNSDNTIYWVTGHSRGGAAANIIGKKLQDSGAKAFTYTYAAPKTTMTKGDYRTIYNLINTEDMVPELPLSGWGYSRYGVDISYDSGNGLTESQMSKVLNAIQSIGELEELYQYSDDPNTLISFTAINQSMAQGILNHQEPYLKLFSKIELYKSTSNSMFSTNGENVQTTYDVTIREKPAFVMQELAQILYSYDLFELSYLAPQYSKVKSIFPVIISHEAWKAHDCKDHYFYITEKLPTNICFSTP